MMPVTQKFFGRDTMRLALITVLWSLGGICGPSLANDRDIPDATYPALARHAAAAEEFVPRYTSPSSISAGDDDKVTWTTLPARPLLTMEQVGDGLDFDPAPQKNMR